MGRKLQYGVGTICESRYNGKYIILARNNKKKKCIIKFLDTGSITTISTSSINSGNIKDKFLPTVHGVGYIGDIPNTRKYSREYSMWTRMLSRCYNICDPYYHIYGGIGVTVCDEWKCFSTFLKDFQSYYNYQNYAKADPKKHNGLYGLFRINNIERDDNGNVITEFNKENCELLTRTEFSRRYYKNEFVKCNV